MFGQVARGGYVPYADGQRADAYVAAAGGLAPAASAVYVVDAATGALAADGDTVVRPGDAVFVSREATGDSPQYESLALQREQIERQDARDRRQARYQLIQTGLATLGTLISAISLINVINRD